MGYTDLHIVQDIEDLLLGVLWREQVGEPFRTQTSLNLAGPVTLVVTLLTPLSRSWFNGNRENQT